MSEWTNFDWKTYLKLYPDLGRPNFLGKLRATWHWSRYGRFEGRCFPRHQMPEAFPEEVRLDKKALRARLEDHIVPVVICIDVEPDEQLFPLHQPPAWSGFEKTVRFLAAAREDLAVRTRQSVAFNWFCRLDPQISKAYGGAEYPLDKYRSTWRKLLADGDEIALHTHGYRYHDRTRSWIRDYGDACWMEECLSTGVEAFRRVFGKPPASHRFGDRWLDDRTLDRAEELGIRHDLTLEPGISGAASRFGDGNATGVFPDMRGIGPSPYIRFRTDFRRPAADLESGGMWMIPLSSGAVIPGLLGAAGRLTTLNLCCDPRQFRRTVIEVLGSRLAPVLAAVMRTEAMNHPYFSAIAQNNLNSLAIHPAASCFEFATPARAIQVVTAAGTASGVDPGRGV